MPGKSSLIEGLVYVLGDNIDTDQIIPAQYLNLVPTISAEYRRLGSHAFAGLPDDLPAFISEKTGTSPFSVIIAGRNFGCGSSREHAPICLGAAGIEAVVAESYARIFFRNAISTGEVYPLESERRLRDFFRTGDAVQVNLDENRVTRLRDGSVYTTRPLGAVGPVVAAGGIFGYARQTGMIPSDSRTKV